MRATIAFALLLSLLAGGSAGAGELSEKEFSSLKKQIQRSAQAGDEKTASEKVAELARDDSARAVSFLCGLAGLGVAYDASRAGLAGMDSEEARRDILKRIKKDKKNDALLLLVDAMGTRGDEFAGDALAIAMKSKSSQVQRVAMDGIKRKKLTNALDAVIDFLERVEKKQPDGLNTNLARQTLSEVTDEYFETAADWRKYWEPRRDHFAPSAHGGGEGGGTKRRKRERPTFFGTEILSHNLVFVIDVSGSMTSPSSGGDGGGAGTRIERAKNQLKKVVEALPEKSRFTIMAYSGAKVTENGKLLGPPDPDGLVPPELGKHRWLWVWEDRLMKANGKNRKAAVEFVSGLKADGMTFTLSAIRHAFEVQAVDTIVLLSDGVPSEVNWRTEADITTDEILAEVKKINRRKRLIINTFGFGTGGASSGLGAFLAALAEQNGGTFKSID